MIVTVCIAVLFVVVVAVVICLVGLSTIANETVKSISKLELSMERCLTSMRNLNDKRMALERYLDVHYQEATRKEYVNFDKVGGICPKKKK